MVGTILEENSRSSLTELNSVPVMAVKKSCFLIMIAELWRTFSNDMAEFGEEMKDPTLRIKCFVDKITNIYCDLDSTDKS